MKRVLAIILCILIVFPCLSVRAEEAQKFYKINIDSGSGVITEKAIVDNDDIYIPATSFSKYTRFSFNTENNLFLIDGQDFSKAIKSVHIDRKNKKIRVSNTHLIELQGFYEHGNILYLPLTQLLPILNADIYEVKDGVIYISNNQLSLAEVLYDFNIQDYWFNISEEFGNNTLALWWFVVPNYILDTITGCRFDRLAVTYSGNYNDYKNIFSEFLADDNIYLKALADERSALDSTVELFSTASSLIENLKSAYNWVESAGKSDIDSSTGGALLNGLKAYYDSGELKTDDLKGLSDAWTKGDISFSEYIQLFTYIHTYITQIKDHRQMLAAVYDLDAKNYFKSEDFKAAKQVYNLYGENVETAIIKEITQKFSEEVLNDLLSPFAVYNATAKVAGTVLKSVMPYDYGDVGNLPIYSNVVLTASSKINQYSFETDKETENKRLSLLLTLIASKRCFEIMSDSFEGYGKDNSYYKNKIDKLEKIIMALYIVEENTEFDSFEHYEEYAKNNKKDIKKVLPSLKEYGGTNTPSSSQLHSSSSSPQSSSSLPNNATSSNHSSSEKASSNIVSQSNNFSNVTSPGKLIELYDNYVNMGFCCDYTEVYDSTIYDALTEDQKQWATSLVKSSCCHTISEAKAHIEHCLSSSLLDDCLLGDIGEELFLEHNGELFFVVGGKGHICHDYEDLSIQELPNGDLIVLANVYNASGERFESQEEFSIKKSNNSFVINSVKTLLDDKIAKEVAEEYIGNSQVYSFLGVCCYGDFTYEDMSKFLTQRQKENYHYCQYKISCCDSIQKVNDHVHKYMANVDALVENLFYDDNGDLYLLFAPFGFEGSEGYGEISIVEFSPEKIVAFVPIQDAYGQIYSSTTFVIEKVEGKWQI